MYYLYHIPGKKIGVTRDLMKRVTQQQGYTADEYEVLFTSEDINVISNKEIELQKSYDYKSDMNTFKTLTKSNSMDINATEQTSTFPVSLNKLKGRLMDNLGLTWYTDHGKFTITLENIPWIMTNARTSNFDKMRSYVYNKAFASIGATTTTARKKSVASKEDTIYDLIRTWANDKGIYDKGDTKTQYLKLMEEVGELADAILKDDKLEIVDAIGDIIVVLTNLAALEQLRVEDCIQSAYDVIKNRKGKMQNGTFVKEGKVNYTQTL
jgi:NTP pyrophosphatase (non-canonical NTP hydrolase)